MSVTELETRIVKMQEWEQLAQDAAAEAEAIRDTIKAEMLARDTDELTAGRFMRGLDFYLVQDFARCLRCIYATEPKPPLFRQRIKKDHLSERRPKQADKQPNTNPCGVVV